MKITDQSMKNKLISLTEVRRSQHCTPGRHLRMGLTKSPTCKCEALKQTLEQTFIEWRVEGCLTKFLFANANLNGKGLTKSSTCEYKPSSDGLMKSSTCIRKPSLNWLQMWSIKANFRANLHRMGLTNSSTCKCEALKQTLGQTFIKWVWPRLPLANANLHRMGLTKSSSCKCKALKQTLEYILPDCPEFAR